MTRLMLMATCVLVYALPSAIAGDPPKKLTPSERQELEAKREELSSAGLRARQMGKYPEAQTAYGAVLEIARRLYPKDAFPDGHADLATSMNVLSLMLQNRGKLAEAEPLVRDALEMRRRLFKDDHQNVATSLNNLALLLQKQGKFSDAEPLYREALAMRKRLFKGDHQNVANSLNNLAFLLYAQGKLTDAEPLVREALEMRQRLFMGDHFDVALSLNNLATLLQTQGKLADAEPLFRAAVEMNKRLLIEPCVVPHKSLIFLEFDRLNQLELPRLLSVQKRLHSPFANEEFFVQFILVVCRQQNGGRTENEKGCRECSHNNLPKKV